MASPLATLAMTLLVSQGVIHDDNSNLAHASAPQRPQVQPLKRAPQPAPASQDDDVRLHSA